MTAKQAGSVWAECRTLHLNAVSRFIERGALSGEHVVEIEPGHVVDIAGFKTLLEMCERRKIELSYGRSPRRVLVLA